MFSKLLAIVGVGLLPGLVGCTHNAGGMSYGPPTTTMSDDGLTKEQLQSKADDEMKQGTAMQAKGAADNSTEEMTRGQQMQDDAQKLLDKARALAPSK